MSETITPKIRRLADASFEVGEAAAVIERARARGDLPPSDPLALTLPEAARRLSVSASTIRAMIADGRLPIVRIVGRKGSRGRVLIRTADLDTLLDDMRVMSAVRAGRGSSHD